MNFAGFIRAMTDILAGLEVAPIRIGVAIWGICIVMGCAFDPLAMPIQAVPIFAAILKLLGVDMAGTGLSGSWRWRSA